MQRIYPFLFCLAFLFNFIPAQSQWTEDTLYVPKYGMYCTSIGNKVVLFAGAHEVGNLIVDIQHMEMIDIETGEKEIVNLPEHQIEPSIAVLGSKLLFAGGLPVTNKINIYDTINKSWSSVEMIRDKQAISVAYNDTLAFFGGGYSYSEGKVQDDVEIYNSTSETMTQTRFKYFPYPFPVVPGRQDIAGIHINGKILFAGGNYSSVLYNMVNIYDVKSQTWLENDSLSQKKTGVTAFVYNNKAYFAGGEKFNSNGQKTGADTIDIYDPATGEWDVMQIPPDMMPSENIEWGERFFSNVVVSGCKMFLHPKMYDGATDTITIYDFARDQWSKVPLPHEMCSTSMVACKNKVYFAGGRDLVENRQVNYIDIYNLNPKLITQVAGAESASVSFADTPVEKKDTLAFTLLNDGDYELVLDENPLEISGPDASLFTFITEGMKDTLQPLEELIVQVIFSPETTGEKQAQLVIRSNDPENPEKVLTLTGTATPVLSIPEPEKTLASAFLYPNPAKEVLHVQVDKKQEAGTWKITDLKGIDLKAGSYTGSEFLIAPLNLEPGIYLLQVKGDQWKTIQKLVVE